MLNRKKTGTEMFLWLLPEDYREISGGHRYNQFLISWGKKHHFNILWTDFVEDKDKLIRKVCDQLCDHRDVILIVDSLILQNDGFKVPDFINDLNKYLINVKMVAMNHVPKMLISANHTCIHEIENLSHCDAIVSVSKATSNDTRKLIEGQGFETKNIQFELCSPGYESPLKLQTRRFRKWHEHQPIKLLTIANLSPVKDIRAMLRVVSTMSKKFGNRFSLTIVGSFADAHYEKLVKRDTVDLNLRSDQVQFVGFVPPSKLSSYYMEADFYILTSPYESYSMAVAEALSYSLPTITLTKGGVHDYLNRENSFYYEQWDFDDLWFCMRRYLTDQQFFGHFQLNIKETVQQFQSWNDQSYHFYTRITHGTES